MAKGIPVTLPNVRTAFAEAGYEHAKLDIETPRQPKVASRRVLFELTDGTRGVLPLSHGFLPNAKNARVALIRHVIQGRRTALSR